MRAVKNVWRKLKKIPPFCWIQAFRVHRSYAMYRTVLPQEYARYSGETLKENKILFVEIRYPSLSDNYRLLYEELKKSGKYEIHIHFLREQDVTKQQFLGNCKKLLRDMATAKYVFLDDASKVIGCIKKRPETVVTQVWHACGAFKRFGLSTAEAVFGDDKKNILRYPGYQNLNYVTVSSPSVVWAYEEAMNLKGQGIVRPTGVSRTDLFFEETMRSKALEKLCQRMPAAKGKKVILYAPTFRGRIAEARTPEKIRIEYFQKKLSQNYVFLIKHHPFVKQIPEIPQQAKDVFAYDMTQEMEIEELLAIADICISDYSSLIFEYALLERPMIFFAYDLKEYFDWRGFYYDYEELTPGPVVQTEEELLEYLLDTEKWFDPKRVRQFREHFMGACDGHATERILDMVWGSSGDE